MDPTSVAGPPDPRFKITGLVILLLACTLEVAILYLLIAVETPLQPLVRRVIQNPFGLFTVVMIAFVILAVIMTGLLTLLERRAARRAAPAGDGLSARRSGQSRTP